MRKFVIGISLGALTACSQAPDGSATDTMASGPGVNVTAAPGVAFDYRYSFRLPAERIANAQEVHAQACEKLGVARCRITGMRYRLTDDDSVDAMLALKLDPTIARAFGRQGVAAIEAADGMLRDAEITGTDTGAEVDRQSSLRRQAETERARLDAALAKPGLGAVERVELQRQRNAIDTTVAAARTAGDDARATLASTPVTFEYESGRAIRVLGNRSMLSRALDTAGRSAEATFAFVVDVLARLWAPALLVLGIWIGVRWFRRRHPQTVPID